MAAKQMMFPANRAFTNSNKAARGATAQLYLSGGLTPANFYSDAGLSVSLGSTLTADGLGQFPVAYGDETVPYRLIVKDRDGVELDGGDIDPFYFGKVNGLDGTSASVTIGTVTSVPNGSGSSVTNSGTAQNAVLDFELEAGPQGEQGDLAAVNNLSDVADPPTALGNLGGLAAANNLSELASKLTALQNLGLLTVNDQSGSYTATLADAYAWRRFTGGSAQVLTIPPNSSVAYPVGTEIYFSQSGAGSVTVAGGSGVTVNSPGGVLALSGQYSAGMAKKLAAPDTWLVTGDIGGSGGTTANAVTFASSGGAAPGTTFNGSAAKTVDYSTVGAQPSSPRIQTVASSATVTPTFTNDQVNITAQAAGLTLANPSGTAVPGKRLIIRIKDNATAQSIAYGTQYRAIGVTLPTTTVISKTLYLGCVWNDTDTKLDVLAVGQEA